MTHLNTAFRMIVHYFSNTMRIKYLYFISSGSSTKDSAPSVADCDFEDEGELVIKEEEEMWDTDEDTSSTGTNYTRNLLF